MANNIKPYIVAEMIHNALVPLRRSKGIPVVEWRKLSSSAKDEKALFVKHTVEAFKGDSEVAGFAQQSHDDETAIKVSIIAVMYREDFEKHVKEELEKFDEISLRAERDVLDIKIPNGVIEVMPEHIASTEDPNENQNTTAADEGTIIK